MKLVVPSNPSNPILPSFLGQITISGGLVPGGNTGNKEGIIKIVGVKYELANIGEITLIQNLVT